jgi:hypothetical protein
VRRTPSMPECPFSVATHSPVATSHTLSVLSTDAETMRRPSGNTATLETYDDDASSQKYSGRRAPHGPRVPFQRRHAFAGRHGPHLERLVTISTRRKDAPPVRKHGNAMDLRRSQIITKVPNSGRRAPHYIRVPFQRRHAFAGLDVPHLERVVFRRRHDAPPVRKHGNAIDLRRRHIITKLQWTPRAAL